MEKEISPATLVIFLGILFDTVNLLLKVTPERLVEVRGLVREWLVKTSATRKELESLVGKLGFVSACVRQSRVFISRLLEFLRGLPRQGSHAIPDDLRRDLKW